MVETLVYMFKLNTFVLFGADLCCFSGDQNRQSFWTRPDSVEPILLVPWLAGCRWLKVRLRMVFLLKLLK